MTDERPQLTKIALTFWVPLFVDKTVCPVLASLKNNEWCDETLACDFLRKHIFKTVIEQCNDVEDEFKKNGTPHDDRAYATARQMRLTFSKAMRHVRHYQIGDNMVHIQLKIFTPLRGGRPRHHDDYMVSWVKNILISPMIAIATQLAEEQPTFGEVYKQFARQMKLIDEGRDPFASMHVTADNDL